MGEASSSDQKQAATDPNWNAVNSTLWTSNVTMIIAVILLVGIFILGVWILVKLRHVPTRATVHQMVTNRMSNKIPDAAAALGGSAGFW